MGKQIEIVDDKVIMALEVFEDMVAEIDKLRQFEQTVGNLNGANDAEEDLDDTL